MVLIAVTSTDENIWHVGKKDWKTNKLDGFLKIQADGNELNWIRDNIVGIPFCKTNPTQMWTGDFAWFIYNSIS